MAKKLRRRPKKKLIVIIVIVSLLLIGIGVISFIPKGKSVKESKVVSKISTYGYQLKSNKSSKYKKLFEELKKILSEKEIDEEKYAKKISEMFIVDFYSLGDHVAKTDVGGVDFVHSAALDNFIMNAEDTFYKYVESNIYNQRKQELPIVSEVTIESVEQTEFTYNDITDENAYEIKLSWTYVDEQIANDYQNEATLVFVHEDKKLVLVELLNDE